MSLTFGSWCSGIEAASEAWLPLGWQCAYVAEIEPFPCAYLHQRHGAGRPRYMPKPDEAEPEDRARCATMIRANNKLPEAGRLINFGDISQVRANELPKVDLIAAGFPCQDFSIAGLRASLSGGRGSLSITGVRLLLEAADLGLVRGAVLEQVPDVLNTVDNAWGNILGALVGADAALEGLEHGGKWPRAGMVAGPRARVAWRILDAQHFGLAQRRERVWAVVDFGNGPDPAAVLFERKGMFGHPSASGQARKDVAGTLDASLGRSRGAGTSPGAVVPDGTQRRPSVDVASTLLAQGNASGGDRPPGTTVDTCNTLLVASHDVSPSLRAQAQTANRLDAGAVVAHSLRGEGFDASEDGTGRGTPIVPVAIPINSDATRDGQAATPSADAAGRVRLRDPGLGIGSDGDPMFTVQTGAPHAVAYSIMPRNSGKDYKAREVDVAQPLMASGPVGGDQGGDYILQPIAFNARQDPIHGPVVGPVDTDGGTHAIAFSLRGREGGAMPEVERGDVAPGLRAADGGSTRPFIAFAQNQRNELREMEVSGTLAAEPGMKQQTFLAGEMAVRRITVVEAEILQGFPPNATLIDWPSGNRKGEDLAETIAYLVGHGFTPERAAEVAQTPDGPRYKAIGNSWPVTVPRWIGERIQALEVAA